MTVFGPVSEAARGGHTSPLFDFLIGFVVLALTWVGFFRKEERKKVNIWAAIGITAICAVLIAAGIRELIQ
jgi:hypothetical protein